MVCYSAYPTLHRAEHRHDHRASARGLDGADEASAAAVAGAAVSAATSEPLDLDDIQGLVVRGYGRLPEAAYLLLQVRRRRAGRATCSPAGPTQRHDRRAARPTTGDARGADRRRASGADRVGRRCPAGSPSSSRPAWPPTYRSRLLGDSATNDPAGWAWGGPAHRRRARRCCCCTPTTADGLPSAGAAAASPRPRPAGFARASARWTPRRSATGSRSGSTTASPSRCWPGCPARERLGGRASAPASSCSATSTSTASAPSGRCSPPRDDPRRHPAARPDGTGAADLGRNGTLPGVPPARAGRRRLRRVPGPTPRRSATAARRRTAADCSAAKIVGRWPSGAPLVLAPEPTTRPTATPTTSATTRRDPDGLALPDRRAHPPRQPARLPRPEPGTAASLAVNRRHRLLRRGRGVRADRAADGTARAGPVLPVPQRQPGPPVRVRPAQLAERPGLQPAGRRRRTRWSASGTAGPGRSPCQATPGAPPLPRTCRSSCTVRGGAYFFLPGHRGTALPGLDRPAAASDGGGER